jgi:hypothetical protein
VERTLDQGLIGLIKQLVVAPRGCRYRRLAVQLEPRFTTRVAKTCDEGQKRGREKAIGGDAGQTVSGSGRSIARPC